MLRRRGGGDSYDGGGLAVVEVMEVVGGRYWCRRWWSFSRRGRGSVQFRKRYCGDGVEGGSLKVCVGLQHCPMENLT